MSTVRSVSHSGTAPGRVGRPRTAALPALNERILAAAADLFLQYGFDGTSMDAVAARARTSKRTLYVRYQDKARLFQAVLCQLLGRLSPVEALPCRRLDDLDASLREVARDLMAATLKPEFLAVHRVITFEAQRWPDFSQWLDLALKGPRVRAITAILDRFQHELRVTDFDAAADQFWSLTLDSCLRAASLGQQRNPRDIDTRIGQAVDLFLSGIRRRDADAPRIVTGGPHDRPGRA
jgi:AcrR family transcriptional regulator